MIFFSFFELYYNFFDDFLMLIFFFEKKLNLSEMADGRPPFADLNPMKVLFELANNPVCKLKEPSKWSQMFNSFTEFCCKAQPTQRPSSDHMIKHPFLASASGVLTFPGESNSNAASKMPRKVIFFYFFCFFLLIIVFCLLLFSNFFFKKKSKKGLYDWW